MNKSYTNSHKYFALIHSKYLCIIVSFSLQLGHFGLLVQCLDLEFVTIFLVIIFQVVTLILGGNLNKNINLVLSGGTLALIVSILRSTLFESK